MKIIGLWAREDKLHRKKKNFERGNYKGKERRNLEVKWGELGELKMGKKSELVTEKGKKCEQKYTHNIQFASSLFKNIFKSGKMWTALETKFHDYRLHFSVSTFILQDENLLPKLKAQLMNVLHTFPPPPFFFFLKLQAELLLLLHFLLSASCHTEMLQLFSIPSISEIKTQNTLFCCVFRSLSSFS